MKFKLGFWDRTPYIAPMEWSSSINRPIRFAPGFVEPCIPTRSQMAPAGGKWIHEIKHDGYRLIVRKKDDAVRIFTRRGFDWTKRFPIIRAGVSSLKASSVTIDGEGVVCDADGLSDFDRLHSQAFNNQAFLYAFDLLELDGIDCRTEALERRKAKLQELIDPNNGVRFVEHLEGDGNLVFEHACKLKLEGIVSKRRNLPYRSGPSKTWLKIKNPASPAMQRVADAHW